MILTPGCGSEGQVRDGHPSYWTALGFAWPGSQFWAHSPSAFCAREVHVNGQCACTCVSRVCGVVTACVLRALYQWG